MGPEKTYLHEDYYAGIKKYYFLAILDTIIKIGNLKNRKARILDFGCGNGKLKQLLGNKVTGYDALPELSEVKDWRRVKFDVIVVNEVFYLFTKNQIRKFLSEAHKINPEAEFVVGMSKQNIINKTIAFFVKKDAFYGTKLSPEEEINTLKEQLEVLDKKTVFFMCDVYRLKFKKKVI